MSEFDGAYQHSGLNFQVVIDDIFLLLLLIEIDSTEGFPGGTVVKNLPANAEGES